MSILVRTGTGINDVQWKDSINAGEKVFTSGKVWKQTASGGSYTCLQRTGGGINDVAYAQKTIGFSASDLQKEFNFINVPYSSATISFNAMLGCNQDSRRVRISECEGGVSFSINKITLGENGSSTRVYHDPYRTDCTYIFFFLSKSPSQEMLKGMKSVVITNLTGTYSYNIKETPSYGSANPINGAKNMLIVPLNTTEDISTWITNAKKVEINFG